MQNLNQSWLESAKGYNFFFQRITTQIKSPHPATQKLVFNLQNKYNKFLFRASVATLIEKEKRKEGKTSTGEGVERTEVPYIVTYAHIYIRLSFW